MASEKAWLMHPPQLQELFDLVGRAHMPNALNDVRSQFGVHADDPTRIQRVGNVAVIPITGTIRPKSDFITRYFGGTSLELLERDFRAAVTDSQVKSIVLMCDSYGGSADQNEEVSKLIYSSRGKKPIRAFVRGGCCSACYYIASAADSIDASPSSMLGSIGCIAIHEEYAQALEDFGVGATVITYGSKKGHGNVYEKLSPEAKASLQKMVDDYGTLFTAAVARNRGVSVDVVNSKFGQGSAFLAAEALEKGLIDRVSTWEQVLADLSSDQALVPVESKTPESATAAGASAAVQTVLPPVFPAGREVSSVDPKVKAMLFARGLITSIDANDEECKIALRSYFAGRNETQPTTTEAIINSLMAPQPPPAAQATPAAVAPAATSVAPATPAGAAATQPTQTDLVAAERQRVLDLQAAAPDFGIEGEALQTAINSGAPYESVVAGWQRARVNTHRPVSGQVTQTGSGGERFMIDAANALALRAGCNIPAAARNQHVERLQRAPLLHFAEQCLQHGGSRIPDGLEPVERAELALQASHSNRINIGADAGPYNRPGDFPALLSNLANTILLEGVQLAEVSFEQWTGRVADDLADFHPAPMVRRGEAEELDEVLDAEPFKELKVAEELNSYLQLARYGNHIKLTPVMVAQDKLGAFRESLWGLSIAHETKLNRLCLSILTGNVTLLDGIALFEDGNHNNLITAGGGGPSDSQWQTMLNKYWAQQTVGNTGYQGGRLAVSLVPPGWDKANDQTFATLSELAETKQPVTDATINTYRGKVKRVTEPELQRASTTIWYGFADPMRRPTVKVAYFRGWGRNGKRERWFDPSTKCQCFSLEGRFGAAAADFRTAVRNPGS